MQHIHEHDARSASALLDEFDEPFAAVARKPRDFHIGIGAQHDAGVVADELLVICNHDLDSVLS